MVSSVSWLGITPVTWLWAPAGHNGSIRLCMAVSGMGLIRSATVSAWTECVPAWPVKVSRQGRGVPMPLLILVAALVILDILAPYFGVDSRDGFNQASPVR
jgi:hypothetical protein